MSKRAILGIAAALIFILGWWSCHRGGSSNPAQSSGDKAAKGHNPAGAGGAPVPVVAGKAEEKDMPIYLDGLGTVQAFNTVTVHTRVDGELQQVLFT